MIVGWSDKEKELVAVVSQVLTSRYPEQVFLDNDEREYYNRDINNKRHAIRLNRDPTPTDEMKAVARYIEGVNPYFLAYIVELEVAGVKL
jgi:hypothetical protein